MQFCVIVKIKRKEMSCEFNFLYMFWMVFDNNECKSAHSAYLEKHQLDSQPLWLPLEKRTAIAQGTDDGMPRHRPHAKQPIAWTVAFYWQFEASTVRSGSQLFVEICTMFVRYNHLSFHLELAEHLLPLKMSKIMKYEIWNKIDILSF